MTSKAIIILWVVKTGNDCLSLCEILHILHSKLYRSGVHVYTTSVKYINLIHMCSVWPSNTRDGVQPFAGPLSSTCKPNKQLRDNHVTISILFSMQPHDFHVTWLCFSLILYDKWPAKGCIVVLVCRAER